MSESIEKVAPNGGNHTHIEQIRRDIERGWILFEKQFGYSDNEKTPDRQ